MPLYTYQCQICSGKSDHFNRMAERESGAPECCGAQTTAIITACMIQVPGGIDICYQSPIDGTPIQSMRKRKYDMEKSGCVDARGYVDGWKQNYKKRADDRAEVKKYYDSIPDAVKKAAAAPPEMAN
jgi:uncharacterized LabA/DUF88 family protein